jgi:hypothetical protein
MIRSRMKSFLLAPSLSAFLALGCDAETKPDLQPIPDAPKPAEVRTTSSGKKATKPPLAPMKSPSKPN